MSVIFDSDGGIGLNIEAGEIQKNISRVDNISSGISDEEAIQNGYAFVKATAKNGKIYTTEEHKPIKRLIADNESEENFLLACRDTILNIFAKKVQNKERTSDHT